MGEVFGLSEQNNAGENNGVFFVKATATRRLTMNPMLRFIVPFHSSAPWIGRCLESIQNQSRCHWTCHLADDCSSDGSAQIACEFVRQDSRFVFSVNSSRLYQCGSYQRILGDPDFRGSDICISLDADDYLPDDQVLARILDAYSDDQTWLTWGNHIWTDGSPGICGPLDDTSEIRKVSWRTSHLRTWRLFLWWKIRPEDFLGPDGEPLRVAGDVASMFPMVEMAGDRHVKFLDSINYVYNRSNPASNFRVRPEEQLRNAAFLRAKPPYEQLPDNALELYGNLTGAEFMNRCRADSVAAS
jgi:glycosyltransferase involved in cell wall biosynthesis